MRSVSTFSADGRPHAPLFFLRFCRLLIRLVEPGMHPHLLQTHALVRVGHQDLLAEVLRVVAQRVERAYRVISLLQV